jgi:hypothetical protein
MQGLEADQASLGHAQQLSHESAQRKVNAALFLTPSTNLRVKEIGHADADRMAILQKMPGVILLRLLVFWVMRRWRGT